MLTRPSHPPNYHDLARAMRRNSTPAERELWKLLRDRRMGGHKFVRQFPIPPYIADFCCREKKLVIEADGGGHVEKEFGDNRRTKALNDLGYRVIRFTNDQIMKDIHQIYESILTELNKS